jgi:endonuclease/exonuclease/phosphatase family metal-dependent hydrolase
MRQYILIILSLSLIMTRLQGQEFTVMFYNTENLFDTVDDTLKDDSEFLPDGSRHWTLSRYRQKINSVARVIAAAGEWNPPAIVGLCEVENENVVSDIVRSPVLAQAGYSYVHRESPDRRGIDIALIYRHDLLRVADCRSWIPDTEEGETFDSRNLLYVKAVTGIDTIHIICCHFPSRRGGVLAAEENRTRMASLARMKADSIMSEAGRTAFVMIMGDFNAEPGDPLMNIIADGVRLINTSAIYGSSGNGSYRYQGKWETIDQIIVSGAMTDPGGHVYADPHSFRVFDAPFLLIDDPDYPGRKPFSTYSGYSWSGGYSDHLPVMITVSVR